MMYFDNAARMVSAACGSVSPASLILPAYSNSMSPFLSTKMPLA